MRHKLTPVATSLAAALAAALPAMPVMSQAYPSRPVTIVVPFPPGGSSDQIMRLMARKVQDSVGQTMVVDNRAGAGGVVGAVAVKSAVPDGYTLYMGHTGTHVVNVSLYQKLEYDPIKDFKPITTLFSFPSLLVVHAGLPVRSLQELIAMGKSKKGGLSYTTQGIGTTSHLMGELFARETGATLVHVPMKGAAPAVAEVVAGRAEMMFSSYISAGPFIRDGRLRTIGIAALSRSRALPDVPTLAELGVKGVEIDQWFALYAPAGTPDPVIRKLNEEFVKATKAPDVIKTLVDQAADPMGSTPEELAKMMASEIPRVARVVRESGAKAE